MIRYQDKAIVTDKNIGKNYKNEYTLKMPRRKNMIGNISVMGLFIGGTYYTIEEIRKRNKVKKT